MKMKTLQCSESISDDPSQFPSLMGGGVDGSNEYSAVAQPSGHGSWMAGAKSQRRPWVNMPAAVSSIPRLLIEM